MLFSALGVQCGDLVCAVGGGGKTSLLRALSRAATQRGLTAVLTTTTHMQAPEPGVPLCSAFDPDRLRALLDAHGFCMLGHAEGRRLSSAPGTDFARLRGLADVTLCEADGAHCLSCKAPAGHEPALPPEASLVVGVMGVTALGLPIAEGCHRPHIVARVLDVPQETPLAPEHAALLLTSPLGQRKGVPDGARYVALINQADSPERLEQALHIARLCERRGVRAVVTAFHQGDEPLYSTP